MSLILIDFVCLIENRVGVIQSASATGIDLHRCEGAILDARTRAAHALPAGN
jgi:hypothetical protein